MNIKWLFVFILWSFFTYRALSLKCYICGEEENAISCSNFQIGDPRFSRECELGTRSCRLARKVKENVIVSRTCENVRLDDCKTANSVEFCYCTKDLCNEINQSDDEEDEGLETFLEDETEGSGIILTSTIKTPTTTKKPIENERINTMSSTRSISQLSCYKLGLILAHLFLIT